MTIPLTEKEAEVIKLLTKGKTITAETAQKMLIHARALLGASTLKDLRPLIEGFDEAEIRAAALSEAFHSAGNAKAIDEFLKENPIDALTLASFVASERDQEASALELKMKKVRSLRAKKAADTLHDKPGHARDKQKQIRAIWATGKYTSRDRCAEEECAALVMSFAAARRALRNTPDPA